MAKLTDYASFFQGYNPSGGGYEEWNMWCQAFVSRASKAYGSFVRDYETARAARLASGWLNPDPSTAPLGAVGYWLWSSDDHVAVHVGDGMWMMGSRHVTNAFGGVAGNAGTVSFADFQARAGLTFAGWAGTNGGNVIPVEPVAIAGNQRRNTPGGAAIGRADANRAAGKLAEIAGDDVGTFDGWIRGESVNGNNIWFRGAFSGAFWWSGSFTDTGTHDLKDLNTAVVTPPVVVPKPYAFTKFNAVVTEVIPANITNFQYDNFPTKPTHVVIHQFGEKGTTAGSVVNTFKNPHTDAVGDRQVSAHFVVDDAGIRQMVSLKDRAYHAGPQGNGFVGIESDPNQSAKTVANVNKLLDALEKHYGYRLTPIRHRDVPGNSTSCGSYINIERDYTPKPPVVIPPVVVDPPVVVPPVVIPPVVEPPVVEPPVVEPPVVIDPPVVDPPVVVDPPKEDDPKPKPPVNGGLIAIIASAVVALIAGLAALFGWGS